MSKAMDALERLADTIGGCTCSMCSQNREDTALLRDYITTTEAERAASELDARNLVSSIRSADPEWRDFDMDYDEATKTASRILAIQRQLGRDDSATRIKELEEALGDMRFAYINKDADCPHQFETDALARSHEALSGARKVEP